MEKYTKQDLREKLQEFIKKSPAEDEAFSAFRVLCASLDYVSENDILYLIGEINPDKGKRLPSLPAKPIAEPESVSPPPIAPELKNTIAISDTKKEEMLRRVTTAQWKAGVFIDRILSGMKERADKLGWQGNVRWLVETTIEILAYEAEKDETVKEVPPVAIDDRPSVSTNATDDEAWVSTWDLELQERLQAIVDFMEQDGRANYTRQQIEIGAQYRHPDDTLDKETYNKMSRRLQRDLAILIEDGDIVRIEKPNPKQKGGFQNKIFLYALAPVQNEPPKWYTPDLKKHLTGALDAFDAHDLVKLKDSLTTALDALDAFDGQ